MNNENRTYSLIAEIPDPECPKLEHFPALRTIYGMARKFVTDSIQEPPTQIKELDEAVKIRVTGILFFDKLAHGRGHGRNGIEIHPITSSALAE